ncbi:hypothetical protein GYMLUDRAFT_38211 [Collybiopsis luxurians FD-317 M1]|nr:hypothetical protein GYMLUDRAFT_38211 [Collybiopsis luxurians FD-317 M1]
MHRKFINKAKKVLNKNETTSSTPSNNPTLGNRPGTDHFSTPLERASSSVPNTGLVHSSANIQSVNNSILQEASNFTIDRSNFNVAERDLSITYSTSSNTANDFLLKMPYASQAFFDTDIGIQNARKFCSTNTRVQILADIEAWAGSLNHNTPSGYWISGMAGTGKSTIAMSMCKTLRTKGILAGSFFCSRQIPECRDYRLIIPTLSYELAKFSGVFANALKDSLAMDFDFVTKNPAEQTKKLLIEPWSKVLDTFKGNNSSLYLY